MIHTILEVEKILSQLLKEEVWKSVDINYHPPRVERLWTEYNNYRISLHCIHPCTTEEALIHPHPWPSAMRIVQGSYEMGIGYSSTNEPPTIAAKVILNKGCLYEMTDMNGWHYVRPLEPCYTLMVTGQPWGRESPKSSKPLESLSKEREIEILSIISEYYKRK